MEEYDYIGVVFEKELVDGKLFLNPIDVCRLKVNSDFTCETPDYGTLKHAFRTMNIEDQYTIGFVISVDDISKLGDNFNNALDFYLDELLKFEFFQVEEEGLIKTFKFDPQDNSITELSRYDGTNLYTGSFSDNEDPEVIKKIYTLVSQSVIGQDEQIKKIIATIGRNLKIENYRAKTNLLVIGPNNCGKSEIFKTIKENTSIPTVFVNASSYLKSGFTDDDVFDLIYDLKTAAKEDLDVAQRGIVVINNIQDLFGNYLDEKAEKMLVNSLLTFIKGNSYTVSIKAPKPETIEFNSSFVTFVFTGEYHELVDNKIKTGFGETTHQKQDAIPSKQRLIDYGFPKEVIDNTSVYILKELSKDDLANIMTKSRNSTLLEYFKYAANNGVEIKITNAALDIIAQKAFDKKMGANGINAVLEELLGSALFEIEMNGEIISSIIITEDTINNEPPYLLTKKRKRNRKE